MYVENEKLAEALYFYLTKRKRKYENKLVDLVMIIIQGRLKALKFKYYTNIHNDMVANALYYFSVNLNKGNIKIRRLEPNKSCYLKTKKKVSNIQIKKHNLIDEYNTIYDLLGQEVTFIRKVSKNLVEIKPMDSEETIIIHNYFIGFSNIFSYVLSIVEDSFWKIVNEEKHQANKNQLFFNTSNVSDDTGLNKDTVKFDHTSDTNREKIENMRQESIEYDKMKAQKRKKNIKVATNNLWEKDSK